MISLTITPGRLTRRLLTIGLFAFGSTVSIHCFASDTIKILPLGDSITQGGNSRPSYRRALWLKLQDAGYNVDFIGSQRGFHGDAPAESLLDFDLDHEGHWGWEANEIAEALPEWLNDYTPDIALIHLGTNDFDRGESIAETLSDLASILTLLFRGNPDMIVLLAEVIPMRFKSTSKLNSGINSLALSVSTAGWNVMIVDQNAGYYSLIHSYDKYHPNYRGEEKIAQQWFDAITRALQEK